MDADNNEKPGGSPDPAMSMMAMMGLMMGVCFGTVLLFSLIPIIGWPLGVALALIGVGLMFFIHQRVMGHGLRRVTAPPAEFASMEAGRRITDVHR